MSYKFRRRRWFRHCAIFHQTLSVNRDPLDLFVQPLLLDMIFLGTPQLRGGVHIIFFYKVSFAKHSNAHTLDKVHWNATILLIHWAGQDLMSLWTPQCLHGGLPLFPLQASPVHGNDFKNRSRKFKAWAVTMCIHGVVNKNNLALSFRRVNQPLLIQLIFRV